MRHGKTTALKCLPLATELLIVFLTADILWQLLCGRPPFSMWGFLLSGGLMTAGNSLFLQKPRRFWQILLLNVLLCAVWIPLLSRTLDLTYPPPNLQGFRIYEGNRGRRPRHTNRSCKT